MRTAAVVSGIALLLLLAVPPARGEFRAGAAAVDVTPLELPVLVNGGMLSRSADRVQTPLAARALVLDDGRERVAIVVVDSCMMPRQLLDEAKAAAAARTAIRPERMMISATHTHSAPAAMGCLGTDADPYYPAYLRERLAEAIAAAESNLEPAQVGWASADAAEFTALRRWILRPDRVADDPFGNPTVRANMHAAHNWDDVIGESGPKDPELALIAVQSRDGRPLAVLANFSMHYFGDEPLSADYFGLFAEGLERKLAPDEPASASGQAPPLVAMMSHGCSGDIWLRDYSRPAGSRGEQRSIADYSQGLVEIAAGAYREIAYQRDADLAMAEARLNLRYRVPDRQRLEWAQRIVDQLGDRPPRNVTEVYAREQLLLDELQATEVVVQALRIGEIGIATTPTETYALTGLKIKRQSPLERTMVIELANGGDGYIPPPEQHRLGGYNTWAARSAGLEVEAEPKIAEAAVRLLEVVAERPRRAVRQSRGPASEAILAARPAAYWRLDEFAGPRAVDASGHGRDGIYEPGVVFYLEGPNSHPFCEAGETNRAAHFAGGRLRTWPGATGDRYCVSLWIWNGMPTDARPVAGWFWSRGHDHALDPVGEHLGVGGAGGDAPPDQRGRLLFLHRTRDGDQTLAIGRATLDRWTWNHVALVRDGPLVRVYLNGDPNPEIEAEVPAESLADLDAWFFGGRCDNRANWEGRLDEISVFDRALTAKEITALGGF